MSDLPIEPTKSDFSRRHFNLDQKFRPRKAGNDNQRRCGFSHATRKPGIAGGHKGGHMRAVRDKGVDPHHICRSHPRPGQDRGTIGKTLIGLRAGIVS